MSWLKALIDIARLVLAKDTRDGLAEASEEIFGKDKDVLRAVEFSARIKRSERTRILDVQHRFLVELDRADISEDTRERFALCLVEMAQNAFEHGCRRSEDQIELGLRIGAATVELTAVQPQPLAPDLSSLRHRPLREWTAVLGSMTEYGGLRIIHRNATELRFPDDRRIVAIFEKIGRIKAVVDPANAQVELEDGSGFLIIRLAGQIDDISPQTTTRLFSRLGAQDLLIDFSEVTMISSSGLKLLVGLRAQPGENRPRTVIFGATGRVGEVLEASFMDQIFEVVADYECAIAKLNQDK